MKKHNCKECINKSVATSFLNDEELELLGKSSVEDQARKLWA